MWRGRYEAILLVILLASVVLAFTHKNFVIFGATFFFLGAFRVGVWLLNLISVVVRGRPLLYDIRIDQR